ncbi:MAG: tetratricopeptide repeat protein [Phycisphaerae bacterium]|nr:tetratricopeptide repeat protein [Phycisphaerae bacterium]
MRRMRRIVCCFIAGALVCVFFVCPVSGQSRRLQIGQIIPAFGGQTVDGSEYKYEHGKKKVLLLSFLRGGQDFSASAAEDLLQIVGGLKCEPGDVDFVVVGNKADIKGYFGGDGSGGISPKIIVDLDFEIWGKFGIIACPTTIIGGLDNKVLCVKAGHSYDFEPVVQARLKQALGIAQEVDPDKAGEVKTLDNHTSAARADRYLHLATAVAEKGKYELALPFAKKALEVDPNSIDARLAVGRLYCQLDDGEAALSAIAAVEPKDASGKAELALIKGWANRRLKKYDLAEKFLLEAVERNSKSPCILFELGNLYQAAGKSEKAAAVYQSALEFLLGKER